MAGHTRGQRCEKMCRVNKQSDVTRTYELVNTRMHTQSTLIAVHECGRHEGSMYCVADPWLLSRFDIIQLCNMASNSASKEISTRVSHPCIVTTLQG